MSKHALSDHFNGRVFFNHQQQPKIALRHVAKWIATRRTGPWKKGRTNNPHDKPPPLVDDGTIRITFVNHATLLIQMDGVNLLTDPIWSKRCSPLSTVGPKRMRPPGVHFADLPKINAALVSHNHYDHLDIPTLRLLTLHHPIKIVTGLGNQALLHKRGMHKTAELDWWEQTTVSSRVRVTAVPAQHFSGRTLLDRNKTLWAGYVVEGPSGTVYFAGDTGYSAHFKQIRDQFGPITVALLPIGAFQPRWFMHSVHIDPAEAVQAALDLEAKHSIGMHFGTFRLGDDAETEPLEELARVLSAMPNPIDFVTLDFGEGRQYQTLR